ncbi:MAG: PEP-CTERM sorting domain-containing protein [Deltaproteobacteria bacterium]|nr:PEP-CTERM sorting domain-containing protein [Deltaproteobacteria bacterium]
MKTLWIAVLFLFGSVTMANAVPLAGGLGGTAGYGEHQLADNDDGSTSFIDLSSVFDNGMNFYGTTYTGLYLNNNGNVTFSAPLSTYTPYSMTGSTANPIIAPFFADVDTRGSGDVYWDEDTVNGIFTATWNAVGYFSYHTNPLDSFQLRLIDQGGGDFGIEFRYASLGWTVGDVSGTAYARAGYNSGNGTDYYELPESGNNAAMLDLVNRSNAGTDGLFQWQVRNGNPAPVPEPGSMALMSIGLAGLFSLRRRQAA